MVPLNSVVKEMNESNCSNITLYTKNMFGGLDLTCAEVC